MKQGRGILANRMLQPHRGGCGTSPSQALVSLYHQVLEDTYLVHSGPYTDKGRLTLYGTARHDTTRHDTTKPACIHTYRRLADTMADTLIFDRNNKQAVFELELVLESLV
jgi:hypothetical protein